jgi:hypothetical protein
MEGKIVMGEIPGLGYEARFRDLPKKEPGKHRWVAIVTFSVSEENARTAFDASVPKHLDSENMLHMGIGCYDCEEPLGSIEAGSRCPAREVVE